MEVEQLYQLAAKGFRLHPLLARDKVPIIKAWQQKATTDERTIYLWAKTNTNCNWGLATGHESNVFVVDIDAKANGLEHWQALVAESKETLPETVQVKTGSGGLHLYFQYPDTIEVRNSSSKLARGVDIRGENGQVVIPPSIHPNGTTYEWVSGHSPSDTEVARAPKWLLKRLASIAEHNDYAEVGEEMEVGTRNTNVYHHALALAKQNVPREMVFDLMRKWCDTTGNGDIEDAELEKTISSAYKSAAETKGKAESIVTTYLRTDDDNARYLLGRFGSDLVYVPDLGWYVWDGRHWAEDQENARLRMLAVDSMRTLRDTALEEAKDQKLFKQALALASWATQCLNVGRIEAMIKQASAYPNSRHRIEEMDGIKTKFKVNFMNGTLDLETGELYPHRKEDLITKLVPYDYRPEADCPFWNETLHLAFSGNTDLIGFIQRALGYSLSGSIAEQCLFICWGQEGNNGKSTLLETFQRIIGYDYAQMSDMKVITSKEVDNRVTSSLAKLVGTRFVSMNEAEDTQRMSEALVKQMTGGDTLQAKKLYHEPFEYQPVFKLWIRTNEKPAIRGTSDAIWRRIKLIPFDKPIPKELRKSRDVVDKQLMSEAEGILAWAVQGFRQWNRIGLVEPDIVTAAVNNYRTEMDLVIQFLDEMTTQDTGANCPRATLYQSFSMWLRENGYRFTITSEAFSRRVAKQLNQHENVRVRGQYVWKGIRLNEEAQITMESYT